MRGELRKIWGGNYGKRWRGESEGSRRKIVLVAAATDVDDVIQHLHMSHQ